jgi:hypothetical protein
MSEEELARLVMEGRARRLEREAEQHEGDDDDEPDWRARSVE